MSYSHGTHNQTVQKVGVDLSASLGYHVAQGECQHLSILSQAKGYHVAQNQVHVGVYHRIDLRHRLRHTLALRLSLSHIRGLRLMCVHNSMWRLKLFMVPA